MQTHARAPAESRPEGGIFLPEQLNMPRLAYIRTHFHEIEAESVIALAQLRDLFPPQPDADKSLEPDAWAQYIALTRRAAGPPRQLTEAQKLFLTPEEVEKKEAKMRRAAQNFRSATADLEEIWQTERILDRAYAAHDAAGYIRQMADKLLNHTFRESPDGTYEFGDLRLVVATNEREPHTRSYVQVHPSRTFLHFDYWSLPARDQDPEGRHRSAGDYDLLELLDQLAGPAQCICPACCSELVYTE